MSAEYLCHHGTKGMHWGVRKSPTQESIRKKHSQLLDKAAKYDRKSLQYRYRAGKQTQFTKFGVAKYKRLSIKSDRYFYKSAKMAKRGKRYIDRMQKKHPELFDTAFNDLILNDVARKNIDNAYFR